MKVGWSQLVFTPDAEALATLAESWHEAIGGDYTPLLFSVMGDMFYHSASGVYWLNLGTAEISRIADTPEQFHSLLGSHESNNWFLPALVEQLYAAGKIPKPGWCYSFVILPVFKECRYAVSNLNPVPAKEHFAFTASMHSQLKSLPDNAKVRLVVA